MKSKYLRIPHQKWKQLAGISGKSSVLQMRVLELVVKIAQISEDHLQVAPDMR